MKSKFIAILIASVAIAIGCTYFVTISSVKLTGNSPEPKPASLASVSEATSSCEVDLVRNEDYQYIRPLLFAESHEQSEDLLALKKTLTDRINLFKQQGSVLRTSVFLKELNSADWFEINGTEEYHPGSMMKVSILLTWLSMSEATPGLLDKQLELKEKVQVDVATVSGEQLEVGKSYAVRFLLEQMIIHSNNDATALLVSQIDQKHFEKLFKAIQVSTPSLSDWNFTMNPMNFDKLFRILYNASYLERVTSEYALSLLCKTEFKGGLLKYIPESTEVAHKFGERFSKAGQQFHEAGIVYLKNKPYTLVVMTEGKDRTLLPEVVATISQEVYNFMGRKK